MMSAFPWTTDVDQFLAMVLASQLLSRNDISHQFDRFRTSSTLTNAKARDFADYLVAAGSLTRWQCDKLLNGQFKGFYLDGFKLLEKSPSADSEYIAIRMSTGGRVLLEIEAPSSTSGSVRYTVISE
jgi:hypothetical protein